MAVQLKNEVCTALESSVEELQNIWDYIGYNEPDRNKRAKEVSDRIQKIFFDIIEEENRFRLELESRVETKKRELAEFSQQLGMKPFFPPRGLSTYRLLAVLDEKFAELNAVRQARLDKYQDLRAKADLYCQRLDIKDSGLLLQHALAAPPPLDDDQPDGDKPPPPPLPSEDELQLLTDKVRELEETYKGLLSKYVGLREDLIRIAADIDYPPGNEFEAAVLTKEDSPTANGDAAHDCPAQCSIVLTGSTLDDLQQWRLRLVKQKAMLVGTCDELRSYLRAMWSRLQLPGAECEAFLETNAGYKPAILELLQAEVDRCQELKWERSAQYLSNLRAELRQLSIKCCVESASRKNSSVRSASSSSDEDNEDSINSLEQEIDRLRELYNRNKTMYDAVYNYQRLWQQYLEVEEKMKDPAILSNRGGILLKTDKEKKRLLKELPRVEQEVSDEITLYEQQNKTAFLLSGGRTFADHVRHLWSERRDGQHRSASATRDRRRLKSAAVESPSASPRRKA